MCGFVHGQTIPTWYGSQWIVDMPALTVEYAGYYATVCWFCLWVAAHDGIQSAFGYTQRKAVMLALTRPMGSA